MSRDEESGNDSAPGTPNNAEKKKSGLKKFLSLKTSKKDSNFGDKSPSPSGRFERDEGEGSRSRRRILPNFFKSSPRKSDKQPTRDIVQGSMQETKKDGTKPAVLLPPVDNKASKEETNPIKVAEVIGEEPKPVEKAKEDKQNNPHKHTQVDDKAESKEHQGPEVVAKAAEHDHQKIQVEDTKGDSKDEQPKGEPEAVEQQSRDFGSPPPPLLQEKEEVGCESIAKGLQKVCLPWTIKKEDH